MKTFLISCHYEIWCQGWDSSFGYFLVNADSFEEACEKLKIKLHNAHGFENRNVE